MLTPEEENFLKYWEDNRDKPRTGFLQYRRGMTIGLVLGIAILISLLSGWYSRANMVENSQSSFLVLVFAIIIIAVFCGFLYRQFTREANEQRYKELLYKRDKENVGKDMQQDVTNSSQIGNV